MFDELKSRLTTLSEPIMLVGNAVPDGDSASSLATILSFLRENGKESYIHFVHPPPKFLEWMFEKKDFHEDILNDYKSLVVVDDYVDSSRLSVPIKEGIEVVNIDHHVRSDISDGRMRFVGQKVQGEHNTMLYWSATPATACVLIDAGIVHPFLWVGLATDTKFFKVKNITTSIYVHRLQQALMKEDVRLTDILADKMLSSLLPTLPRSALESLMNSRIDFFRGKFKGRYVQVCVAQVSTQKPGHAKSVLSILQRFSDVTAVVNSLTLKVSLRSSSNAYPILNIAQSFNGGGHLHAAGCELENLNGSFDRLTDMLTCNLSSIETTLYF